MAEEPLVHHDASIDEVATSIGDEGGFLSSVLNEIFSSYLNIALVGLIVLLLYKIVKSRSDETARQNTPPEPELPKLRRDFTVLELKQYDGNQPDGRVLVAVNGIVYDVTKGKRFYGPGTYLKHQWMGSCF